MSQALTTIQQRLFSTIYLWKIIEIYKIWTFYLFILSWTKFLGSRFKVRVRGLSTLTGRLSQKSQRDVKDRLNDTQQAETQQNHTEVPQLWSSGREGELILVVVDQTKQSRTSAVSYVLHRVPGFAVVSGAASPDGGSGNSWYSPIPTVTSGSLERKYTDMLKLPRGDDVLCLLVCSAATLQTFPVCHSPSCVVRGSLTRVFVSFWRLRSFISSLKWVKMFKLLHS